jgi:predicted nuclease of restriction endonuclease-like RecB superfamily
LVETLLRLDGEGAAVLTAVKERPSAREIMLMYNRGAVKTLLAHSSGVTFNVSSLPGAALKRLYFVAKKRGVMVEIEEGAGGGYALTLFGPEQAFGTADKYGQRLADVALSLLRSLLGMGEDANAGVGATASLTLHDREYRFHLGEEILGRLGYSPEGDGGGVRRVAETRVAYSVGAAVDGEEEGKAGEPSFDSMVEAALYKEHKSLEKQGYTHGWRLLREPDPLLAPGIVMIPDFAFTRGDTRVFMEIAGFWSPSYKERKLSKLRALAAVAGEEAALIVAAPQDAAPIFAGLPYPVVPYKNTLRMTDVLAVLDAKYGGREERGLAAAGQVEALREAALERGLVPEGEVAQALQAYTRTELLQSARALDGEGCRYVAGVGLMSEAALGKARAAIEAALDGVGGRLDLEEAARVVEGALGGRVDVEALVQVWGEWRVERPSLFEGYLVGGS